MPPLFMMLPPREKNGSASREKESTPSKHFCAATNANLSNGMPAENAVRQDAMPMPAEIGTPAKSMTKNEPKSTRMDCATITAFLPSQ